MNDWKITLHDRQVQQFSIEEGQTVVVGRGAEADVVIDNTAVSRSHMSLQMLNGVCFVSDLGSTNGTLLNDARVEVPTPVAAGDIIRIGKFELTAVAPKAAAAHSAQADLQATVFISPAPAAHKREVARPPRITVVQGHAEPAGCSTEGKNTVRIGKGADNDLRTSGWLVASPQCRVIIRGESYTLIPDGRWRATTLNGNKITTETVLKRGDEIGVAGTRLRFE